MGFSAFQFGFDHGYQVIYGDGIVHGGGSPSPYSWERTRKAREQEEMQRRERSRLAEQKRIAEFKLRAKEEEIAELERMRMLDLADQRMQLQLMALLQEAHQLELERQRLENLLIIFMREDDDLIAILLCASNVT
jgi:hypothetical protein